MPQIVSEELFQDRHIVVKFDSSFGENDSLYVVSVDDDVVLLVDPGLFESYGEHIVDSVRQSVRCDKLLYSNPPVWKRETFGKGYNFYTDFRFTTAKMLNPALVLALHQDAPQLDFKTCNDLANVLEESNVLVSHLEPWRDLTGVPIVKKAVRSQVSFLHCFADESFRSMFANTVLNCYDSSDNNYVAYALLYTKKLLFLPLEDSGVQDFVFNAEPEVLRNFLNKVDGKISPKMVDFLQSDDKVSAGSVDDLIGAVQDYWGSEGRSISESFAHFLQNDLDGCDSALAVVADAVRSGCFQNFSELFSMIMFCVTSDGQSKWCANLSSPSLFFDSVVRENISGAEVVRFIRLFTDDVIPQFSSDQWISVIESPAGFVGVPVEWLREILF